MLATVTSTAYLFRMLAYFLTSCTKCHTDYQHALCLLGAGTALASLDMYC